jgi:hypothetical protein
VFFVPNQELPQTSIKNSPFIQRALFGVKSDLVVEFAAADFAFALDANRATTGLCIRATLANRPAFGDDIQICKPDPHAGLEQAQGAMDVITEFLEHEIIIVQRSVALNRKRFKT